MHSIAAEALSPAMLGEERLDTTLRHPKAATLAKGVRDSGPCRDNPCVDYRCESIGCGWIREAVPSTKSLGVDDPPGRCPGVAYHASLPTAVSLAN